MTLRQYLFLMACSTALCWLAWGAVVRTVDPAGGVVSLIMFYATLALALIGTLALIGLSVRSATKRHEAPTRHVHAAFRQSLLLAAGVIAALVLQSRTLLTGLNAILLIGILSLIELFLISLRTETAL